MGVKRPVDQTPGQIIAVAEKLQDISEALRQQASRIERAGLDKLGIHNHGQLIDGMRFIESYVAAARVALTEALAARGDFGTANTNGAEQKKRAKK